MIWSEGLPSETYLDCGNRNQFQGGKSISLHPDFEASQNHAVWDRERSFAPLVTSGKALAAVRADMHESLLRQGYQTQILQGLTLKANGKTLIPLESEDQWHRIALPEGAAILSICSTSGIPAETNPYLEDRRKLGVALTQLSADHRTVPADDPCFGAGFHAPEHHGTDWFRWTNGAAYLAVSGVKLVEFKVKAHQPVWRQIPASTMSLIDSASASSARASSGSHWRSPA